MSQIIKPSDTIVSGLRRLNVVLPYTVTLFETNNYCDLGGHRLQWFNINANYRTLPVYVDGGKTVYNGDSAIIDGKVYDINKSGAKGAYCLSVNDTSRDTVPVRNINIDNVSLPVNQYGDVIFASVVVPSPFEILEEDAIHWMGRPIRLVRISLMGWHVVINT